MASNSLAQISDRQSMVQVFKSVISNLVSSLSSGMFSYGIGLMLLNDTHSPLSFGMGMVISPIIGLLFFIPIGNFVDQHNHRHILIFKSIARLLCLILFAFSLNYFHGMGEMIPVAIFLTINSFLGNLSSTTYSASVHELVNDKKIPMLSSLSTACSAGSQILSPVLGVILYTVIGLEGFIKIEILSTVFAFVIMLTMKFFFESDSKDDDIKIKTEAGQWQNFKASLQYMKKRMVIRDIIILGSVINFLYTAVDIGIPFMVNNTLHFPNSTIAFLDTGFSIGVIVGSVGSNFLQNKGSFAIKMFVSLLVAGTGILLLGIVFSLANSVKFVDTFGLIIMVTIAMFAAMLNVTLGVRLQRTVPTKILGRVDSTLITANRTAIPIGALIFTFLYQVIADSSMILIVTGILTIVYILICMPFIYKNVKQDDKYLDDKEEKEAKYEA